MVVVLMDVPAHHVVALATPHVMVHRHRLVAQDARQLVQADAPVRVVADVLIPVDLVVQVDAPVRVEVVVVLDVLAHAVAVARVHVAADAQEAVLVHVVAGAPPIVLVVAKIIVVVAEVIVLEIVRQHVQDAQAHVEALVEQDVIRVASHHAKDIVLAVVNSIVPSLTSKCSMDIVRKSNSVWKEGSGKNITFIVTKDCQLACKYCYLVGKNENERMQWTIAKQAIDYILSREDDFNEESVIWDFIGGEPFLEIDLIDKICDYIKMEMYRLNHHWFDSYRFSFSTNGINYHSVKVQDFIKKNIDHLSIGITIDGTKQKHDLNRIWKSEDLTQQEKGSYEDVVSNIPLWLSQFPNGATKVTISTSDIPYICESVLHLYSLGIHEVNINCVFEDVWKEGDDNLFEEQLMSLADEIIRKRYFFDYACSFFNEIIGKPLDSIRDNQNWCGAGMMLAIDAAGNFYPCTRFAGYSLRSKKPIIIGNIKDGIDNNKLRPFLTLDRTTQSPQKCIDCEVASGCAWCQGENYDAAQTNTIYERSTAICKMHKARVRANNYYWNKLFRVLELEGRREEFERNKPKLTIEPC